MKVVNYIRNLQRPLTTQILAEHILPRTCVLGLNFQHTGAVAREKDEIAAKVHLLSRRQTCRMPGLLDLPFELLEQILEYLPVSLERLDWLRSLDFILIRLLLDLNR